MSRLEPIPEPWFSFLKELDELATTTVSLHCIGGFVVTMLYGLNRTTGDLDVLEACPIDLTILRERYTTELRPYLGHPDREDLTLQFWIEDIEEDRASRTA